MPRFMMPGEIEPDGRSVLDIATTVDDFGRFGQIGKTVAPLPAGSRVALNGAPEGLLVRATKMPDPEQPGESIDYPVAIPGFASIDVVFANADHDPLSAGITNTTLMEGLASGDFSLTQHPVRLLHPATHQAVFAAHAENVNDPRIGRQSVAERTANIIRSVVVSSPSIIEPQRAQEPRFATVIPLTMEDPNDPFIEADIMLQIGHGRSTIEPHVIIHSAEDTYDQTQVARIVVGTLELRSPHPVTPDGRSIDYSGLQWRVAAVEPRPAGDINLDMDSAPRVAAILLTTSCIEVTTLETPASNQGARGGQGGFGVNPALVFGGDDRTGPRAIGS